MAHVEEQFVLRVADPALADRLRRILRESETLEGNVELNFRENGREGELLVGDQTHRVHVLDLPTVVETYKTYNDENLVKSGDIGQMLLVGGTIKPGQTESADGVTPPMRRARVRHLRSKPHLPRETVKEVQQAIVDILLGGAPKGMEFHDIEEEWVIDPETGHGDWRPVIVPGSNTKGGGGASQRGTEDMEDGAEEF